MKEVIKILVADDHVMVRNGIQFMLENQSSFIPVVTEATNGDEVLDLIHNNSYDILLSDVHMPKLNGIETTEKLRENGNNIPILIISICEDEHTVRQAIDKGCDGFILKDAGIEELVRAILTILSGKKYFGNNITQILLGANKKKSSQTILEANLTRREYQILELIARECNHDEIASQLKISRRTVEGHKKNLTDKLNVKGSVGLMKFAMDNGVV